MKIKKSLLVVLGILVVLGASMIFSTNSMAKSNERGNTIGNYFDDGCDNAAPVGGCTPGQTSCTTTAGGKECQFACSNSGTWSTGVDCNKLGKVCSSQGIGGKCVKPKPAFGNLPFP